MVIEFFIEPELGFKTGITKESTHLKPKKSYLGEVSYLGGGKKDEEILEIGDLVIIETSSDDELLVLNRSEFYMCPECGYSDKIKGKNNVPQFTKKHNNYRQFPCSNDTLDLLRIGHRFKTDVARLTVPMLENRGKESYSTALSFMYAFLEGMSAALGIDRNDIDGIIEFNQDLNSFDVLLYDNVPGGAGHVKRILNKRSFIDALKKANNKVAQNCCNDDTSCYKCLRNYYNQKYHNKLKRGNALDFIGLLLFTIDD